MNVGNGRMVLGNCLDVMTDIPDGSVDMVLCDLPYGTTACSWDTIIPFEPLWAQYWRIAKPNAAIVLFGAEPFSSALRSSSIRAFKYDWVWQKSAPGGFAQAKNMPLKSHEMISVFFPKAQLLMRHNLVVGCRITRKDSSIFRKPQEIPIGQKRKAPSEIGHRTNRRMFGNLQATQIRFYPSRSNAAYIQHKNPSPCSNI